MTAGAAGARALSPTVRRRLLADIKRRAEAGDHDAAERLIRLSLAVEQGALRQQKPVRAPELVVTPEAL